MTEFGRYRRHRPPAKEGCLSALPLALVLTVKAMLAERRAAR